MQHTKKYTTRNIGLLAALVLGMGITACNSSDYVSNKSSDSTVTGSTTETGSTTPAAGSTAATADSATTANTAASANATTGKIPAKKKKGKTSITWPASDNQKIAKDNEGVYNRADKMPEFPGGQDALASYISNHIEYTQQAIDNNTDGTIQVSFVIDENGKVIDPKVISPKKLGNGLDDAALRVFNAMPTWKPGKVNGKKVKTRLEVPITFQLEEA
jgi:TonB family protein